MARLTRNAVKLSQEINNSQIDIDEFVDNCVRYLLYHSNQFEFRKNELLKTVLKNCGRSYDEIINKTKIILKDVYGMNLLIADTGNNKTYYLSSALRNQNDNLELDGDNVENKEKILLLLILTHIFMSGGTVTEMSLYTFLKQLNIQTDNDDPIFGNVTDYINQTLIKQKYLQNETDSLTKENVFKWGIHAELEISKMKILEFVSQIYGDNRPNDWEEHYEIATKQNLEN